MKIKKTKQPDEPRNWNIRVTGVRKLPVIDTLQRWRMDCTPYEPIDISFTFNIRLLEGKQCFWLVTSQLEHSLNYVDSSESNWKITHKAWKSIDKREWELAWEKALSGDGDRYQEQCSELDGLLEETTIIDACMFF